MKSKYILWPIGIIAMAALMTGVVMLLWNWLMPILFGLSVITFWQALGILILSKILFGAHFGKRSGHCSCNGGGYGGHYGWKQKFKSKWQDMSEEDKKKWESKWGNCGAGKTESTKSENGN